MTAKSVSWRKYLNIGQSCKFILWTTTGRRFCLEYLLGCMVKWPISISLISETPIINRVVLMGIMKKICLHPHNWKAGYHFVYRRKPEHAYRILQYPMSKYQGKFQFNFLFFLKGNKNSTLCLIYIQCKMFQFIQWFLHHRSEQLSMRVIVLVRALYPSKHRAFKLKTTNIIGWTKTPDIHRLVHMRGY